MNGSLPKAYKFTFTPATDDAKIKLVVDNASTAIDKNNADGGADSVAVWTTAGTELKSVTDTSNGTSTWIGNGWRVYIVCDAEGKIAYMVQHPVSGYGGPSGNGYYCHSSYSSDYKTNPAFNILDGYGPWVSGGYVHNLYEVKVPEGGFAITAHGAGVYELYDLLGIDYSNLPEDDPDTTKDEYTNALLNLVNSRTVLGDNIRLSYDSNYNIVIVSN